MYACVCVGVFCACMCIHACICACVCLFVCLHSCSYLWMCALSPNPRNGPVDWTSLHDNVLCKACFQRFQKNGTLERRKILLPKEQKRCTNEKCIKPEPSPGSIFYQVRVKSPKQTSRQQAYIFYLNVFVSCIRVYEGREVRGREHVIWTLCRAR